MIYWLLIAVFALIAVGLFWLARLLNDYFDWNDGGKR